jgi:hypothetical protein
MSVAGPSDFPWIAGVGRSEPSRDRREVERVLSYWEDRLEEFGGGLTVAALDLGRITNRDWSNRFLIAVDPMIERSSLVLYGPKFAQLLHLPEQARPSMTMLRQLPRRYGEAFLRGCEQAQKEMAPVRFEGEVERYDSRVEQYRVVFIPICVRPNSATCFAFGAFNSRVVDAQAAG